jgi:hypothetical protein
MNAAYRLSAIITADVADFDTRGVVTPSGCVLPNVVDDLYLCPRLLNIDGEGGILGQAGPEIIRTDSHIPATGFMEFDIADVQDYLAANVFDKIVTHEMLHIMGFGTTWEEAGVAGTEPENCPYKGEIANGWYKAISGCNTVPTELDFGAGSRCSHWDELCLDKELMTPQFDLGSETPLSRITIGSLADLGYQVDYRMADRFDRGDLNLDCVCPTELFPDRQLAASTKSLRTKKEKGTERRRLSEARRLSAIEHGLSLLKKNAARRSRMELPRGLEYVGDKVVSVFVREGKTIFHVMVRNDG